MGCLNVLVLVLVGGVRAGSDGGAVGGSVHFAAAAANDGFDDDWCISQEAENAMKEAEARLYPEMAAAPDTDDDGDLAAAASRAMGIGCVDDADDDDASSAAEKLRDCADDFATQEPTSALEQEINLPENEDYGPDYPFAYESAPTRTHGGSGRRTGKRGKLRANHWATVVHVGGSQRSSMGAPLGMVASAHFGQVPQTAGKRASAQRHG